MNFIEEFDLNDFDSKLVTPGGFIGIDDPDKSFRLNIYLRVNLIKRDPLGGKEEGTFYDGNGKPFKCKKWTDGQWQTFKDAYVAQANKFWDKAFLLITPNYYKEFDWPKEGQNRRRRNVMCCFFLSLSSERPHATIPVVNPIQVGFRSHARLYSYSDYQADRYSAGAVRWQFYTLPHEVGHLLGLGHPNEMARECVLHPDSDACYVGKFEHNFQGMGKGSGLALDYIKPWQKRIARHTKTDAKDWKGAWLSDEAAFRGVEDIDLIVNHP